jgi:hypothetical protein
VRRTLGLAIGLMVVLLVAVALAYDTWYCPQCSGQGKAFYHCTHAGCLWRWDQPAETWQLPGPPPKYCPICTNGPYNADSA